MRISRYRNHCDTSDRETAAILTIKFDSLEEYLPLTKPLGKKPWGGWQNLACRIQCGLNASTLELRLSVADGVTTLRYAEGDGGWQDRFQCLAPKVRAALEAAGWVENSTDSLFSEGQEEASGRKEGPDFEESRNSPATDARRSIAQELETMELDPITIHNPTGEAWRQCKMGAREMMIRELVMNAVEACRHLPEGEREVRLYSATVDPYPAEKLAIWNRGGMNLRTLLQFSDINAAINKENRIDANFGRGAKIASIMSNRLGMRFRSCFAGRVLEVTLAADPEKEIVGKVLVEDPVKGTAHVRDVTKEYTGRTFGKFLSGSENFEWTSLDWTEVVLMGNSPEQDTVRTPYEDAALPQTLWLFNAVGFRFFSLPPGIYVRMNSSVTRHRTSTPGKGAQWNRFYTMQESLQYASQHTAVSFEGGVVHYILPRDVNALPTGDGNKRLFGGEYVCKANKTAAFGGLVWRGEIHDLHAGTGRGQTTLNSKMWPPLALRWGLVRAHNQISILVELDDDQATNDINRTHLLGKDGARIDPDQFADVVRENMPEWVKAIEKSMEPREDASLKNIRQYLRDLMREFKNRVLGISLGGEEVAATVRKVEEGEDELGSGKGGNGEKRHIVEEGGTELNGKRRRRPMDAPNFDWVDNAWFAEHNLDGLAAHYQKPTHSQAGVIYFNEDHDTFSELVTAITKHLPGNDINLIYQVARSKAKQLAYRAVGTHVVAGLSLLHSELKEEVVMDALSAVVLTTAMATTRFNKHFLDHVEDAREELRTLKLTAAPIAEAG